MTVTPQRHAIYSSIMPVEELFVHLHKLIEIWMGGGKTRAEGCISGLVGENRVEEQCRTSYMYGFGS